MEIRRLEKEEHKNTRELYEEVFSEDSRSFVDYYYTEKTKDNQIYVVEESGGIQAMLHLNPYKVMVNGTEKNANYIVAVATREQYRKRGYMAALLKSALYGMYEAGESFTFLMPAAEAIYLPHDFRTVYEQEKRRFGGEFPAEELKEKECGELAEAAEAYLSANYQVYARRDAAYYERLRKEYASDGGKLMLYRKNGQIADCRIYEPFEEPTQKPKIMIRIVDVRKMLMSVTLQTLTACCFTVTDSIIRENNRCVVITGTEHSGVMFMDGRPENSEGTIPVAALGELLFGGKSVDTLCEEPGVEMTGRLKEELKKIKPLKKIYLNEIV